MQCYWHYGVFFSLCLIFLSKIAVKHKSYLIKLFSNVHRIEEAKINWILNPISLICYFICCLVLLLKLYHSKIQINCMEQHTKMTHFLSIENKRLQFWVKKNTRLRVKRRLSNRKKRSWAQFILNNTQVIEPHSNVHWFGITSSWSSFICILMNCLKQFFIIFLSLSFAGSVWRNADRRRMVLLVKIFNWMIFEVIRSFIHKYKWLVSTGNSWPKATNFFVVEMNVSCFAHNNEIKKLQMLARDRRNDLSRLGTNQFGVILSSILCSFLSSYW